MKESKSPFDSNKQIETVSSLSSSTSDSNNLTKSPLSETISISPTDEKDNNPTDEVPMMESPVEQDVNSLMDEEKEKEMEDDGTESSNQLSSSSEEEISERQGRSMHITNPVGRSMSSSPELLAPISSKKRPALLNAYGIPIQQTRSNSLSIVMKAESTERIRVCVRKRPISSKEKKRNETDIVSIVGRKTCVINEPRYVEFLK